VHTKDFFIYNGRYGKAIETIGKGLPQFYTMPPFAFVVKAINSVDGSAFVVASKNEKVFGKFNLIREQQADGLQALATTIYIIAEEEVV